MELLNGGTPVPITDVIILAGSPPTKSPEWGVRMARRGYAGPLIVLVPRQSHADLESLDAGADVCLERSVGPNVVIAYILALSRRYGATRRTPDNRELKCIDRPALFEHRRLPTFTQLLRPLFRVPRFRSRSREASAFDARLDGVLLQDRTQPLARFASRRITEDHKPAGHLGRAKYY